MPNTSYNIFYEPPPLEKTDEKHISKILKIIGFLKEADEVNNFWEMVSKRCLIQINQASEFRITVRPTYRCFECSDNGSYRFRVRSSFSDASTIINWIEVEIRDGRSSEDLRSLMEEIIASDPTWEKISS